MNICMIVFNNATRDGRVMREAHTLRAAGHAVTVIGVPESGVTALEETLSDGVKVIRVPWQERVYRKHRILSILRLIPCAAAFVGALYGLYRLFTWLFAANGPAAQIWSRLAQLSLPAAVVLAVTLLAFCYTVRIVGRAVLSAVSRRQKENDAIRRAVIAGTAGDSVGRSFPAIQSRIPNWMPDFLLEIIAEPLNRLGARTGNFSLYRYRSRELAAAAIGRKPDVIHCHDCVALPAGWLVKKTLGIPLIYDAHEIYEAVAARRFGATDYFARVHRKYLPHLDGFVVVNDSAATYYRHAYPTPPEAVVIRNATNAAPVGPYDGRLHNAAGLPASEKILLYQGGFTKDRGLPTLVRSGALLAEGWSLVLMGWGPLENELKRIAGGSAKVQFLRAVRAAELLSWTQGATAGIVPYEDTILNHWIATPNKLWEYPNAGVPLIVQPFPEMRRIVETYKCGWILPAEFTPRAIADLVESLTDEAIAQAKLGCERFSEEDSWASIYRQRLLSLYGRFEERNSAAAASAVGDAVSPARAA